MIKPITIAIDGLDNTEAMFANVLANFAKITKTTDKLKNRFPALSSVASKALNGLKSVIGGLAKMAAIFAGAFGAIFTVITVKTMQSIDALGKMSSKIGTTAGSLAKLQFAAEQTGVSAETMGMAMQRFTRRAAEAARGTGEAKGALKELNLNAAELLRLPLEDQMLALSKAFESVQSPADKVRLAMKLFDSEGVALVNTLGAGQDGLKAMFKDAEQLGLVLSEDAVDGVEAANDAFGRLKTLFTGFTRQAVASFAPAIKAISDELVELGLKAADGKVSKIGDVIAKGVINAFIKIVEVIASIANALQTMAFKVESVYRKFFASEETKAKKKELEDLNRELFKLGVSTASLKTNNLSDENVAKLKQQAKLEKEIIELQQEGQTAPTPYDASGLIKSLTNVRDAVGQTESAFNAWNTSAEKTSESLNAFSQSFTDWSQALPSYNESVKSLTDQGLNGLTDALTAGVTGAANFADAMKAMAKSVIDSLIKMLIQKYIVDAAFGFITGKIGGSGVGRDGGITMIGNGQDYSNTAAIGGPVFQGERTLVGERGPEVFVPNANGSIIPNHKLGGGGVTVNQTINVTTGIQSTVRAEIVQLMPQIAQAAKGAVADARLRGGNFSKAMGGA